MIIYFSMNVSSRYYHKISVMTSSHKFQILPTMKLSLSILLEIMWYLGNIGLLRGW